MTVAELIKELSQVDPNLPIIIVTSFGDYEVAEGIHTKTWDMDWSHLGIKEGDKSLGFFG